jgi:hypothetical protein
MSRVIVGSVVSMNVSRRSCKKDIPVPPRTVVLEDAAVVSGATVVTWLAGVDVVTDPSMIVASGDGVVIGDIPANTASGDVVASWSVKSSAL